MPIPATCSCGKRFAANDSLAGERVACPACGRAIAIPAPGGQATGTPAAPIIVACLCGQRFQAPAHLAGKQVPCPQCGGALFVPAETGMDPLLADLSGAPGLAAPQTAWAPAGPRAGAYASYSQYAGPPSPRNIPWKLIAGLAGVILLLGVFIFACFVLLRVVKNLGPREYARSSKLPPEFIEQEWKKLNPGEVAWERTSGYGGWTVERPSAT